MYLRGSGERMRGGGHLHLLPDPDISEDLYGLSCGDATHNGSSQSLFRNKSFGGINSERFGLSVNNHLEVNVLWQYYVCIVGDICIIFARAKTENKGSRSGHYKPRTNFHKK